MSLLIWLPLDGSIENLGTLSGGGVVVTNSGATVLSTGKTGGSCYNFGDGTSTTASKGINLDKNFTDIGSRRSICAWIRPKGNHYHYSGAIASSGNWNTSCWAFCLKQDNTGITGFDAAYSTYVSYAFSTNVWYHVAACVNNGTTYIYVNGSLISTTSRGSGTLSSDATNTMIGRETYGGGWFSFNGDICDFRIYNHCLSQREVHDISKNLIVHYKCNLSKTTGTPLTNLVANGFGGTDNWAYKTSSYVSTDVPSGTTITNSYGANNYTLEYIPIIQNHTYSISQYVKSINGSFCYIALLPYDADYNQIGHHMSCGFRASSLTTLSQDLKNGDSTIYMTNASGWANPSTYEYVVAIFGYTDKSGYTYPDLIYTRRVYEYGTTTDKSNLDIANNKVTLRSAYSGPTIPAGTSICLTTYGGTYFYPTSCPGSYASDWHQLATTFTPQNQPYLRAAKYIRVMTMGGYNTAAGTLLTDTTAGTTILDMSGYGHNGTMYGSFESDSTSPRYDNSLKFDGGNTAVLMGNLATLITDGIFSFNVWFKVSTFGYKGWGTIFGGPGGFEFQSKRSGTNSPLLVAYSWGQSSSGGQEYTLDEWHMLTMVRNSSNCKFYLDSSLYYTGSAGGIPSGNYFIGAWNTYSQQNYKGSISDVRLYASNLTDEDISDLYHTSATIDNLGNVSCFEIDEETKHSTTNVEENGYLDTMSIMEVHPYLYMPAGCYIDTGLYYHDSEQCTAKTVIRYDSGGSGRDLMGYSPSGEGYWGVTASGAWEPHGSFSYTDSDITKINIINYVFSSSSEHGYYNIGRLSGTYSVRNKYIYNVKLYKNNVLYRDMYPYVNGTTVGLLDIYNNVFYPASGTSGAILGYDDEDNVAKIFNTHIKGNEFYEI